MYPFHALLLFAANAGAITATAAITEANDTLGATATVLIQAAAGITEADDTLAGTGTVLIQAAAAITEAGDTVSATGTVGEAVTETPSGGWRRSAFDTESDSARKVRIHAERVKLGILPPDPPDRTAAEAPGDAIAEVPATLVLPDPALALDLAQLYTSAYLDQEIARFFREQDDDDAAVLLLAIAALG